MDWLPNGRPVADGIQLEMPIWYFKFVPRFFEALPRDSMISLARQEREILKSQIATSSLKWGQPYQILRRLRLRLDV